MNKFGFNNEHTHEIEPDTVSEGLSLSEEATEAITDLAETLHEIASTSKEADVVRLAVNALLRHTTIKAEFGE